MKGKSYIAVIRESVVPSMPPGQKISSTTVVVKEMSRFITSVHFLQCAQHAAAKTLNSEKWNDGTDQNSNVTNGMIRACPLVR